MPKITQKSRSLSNQNIIITKNNIIQKVSLKNETILVQKLLDRLSAFDDECPISLLTSIPILHAGDIVQVIKSIEQVEELLSERWNNHEARLRNQAKFIYHLWRVINQEEIATIKIKEIIYLFHTKKGNELKTILAGLLGDCADLSKLCSVWQNLNKDMMYYRTWNRQKNLHQTLKQRKTDLTDSFSSTKLNMTTTNFTGIITKNRNKNKTQRLKTDNKENLQQKKTLTKIGQKYPTSEFTINEASKSKDNKKKIIKTQYHDGENVLIDRLYTKEHYKKREVLHNLQNQRRQQEQMRQCTFKPNLQKSRSSSNNSRSNLHHSLGKKVRGYEKSVNRMKDGFQRELEKKKMMEYVNVGENYNRLKQKGSNPPKFLSRKKKEESVLFSIGFQINNRRTIVKIREKDSAEQASTKICQIYGLNPRKYKQEIEEIIKKQMENYKNTHQHSKV